MKRTLHNSSTQDETEKSKQDVTLSRRNFLNTAGAATVGGLAVAAGGTLFTRREAKATSEPQEAPPLPWKYVKLDPMEAGKRGYKNYLEKGG